MQRALGWLVDVLLGWVLGGIVGGLTADVAATLLLGPVSSESAGTLGALVGGIGAIFLLRRRRSGHPAVTRSGWIEYETTDLPDSVRRSVDQELRRRRVRHVWEPAALLIHPEDEHFADLVLDALWEDRA